MSERLPAEAFPPASFITEEMGERGWSREELMQLAGWSKDALDALLLNDVPLTDEQAADLECVFGVSQQFWLNLEISYRRWQQQKYRDRHATRQARAARPTAPDAREAT